MTRLHARDGGGAVARTFVARVHDSLLLLRFFATPKEYAVLAFAKKSEASLTAPHTVALTSSVLGLRALPRGACAERAKRVAVLRMTQG